MVMKALFGYVKAYKPEMKVKDYEVYKGVYCSLCRQLGHDYGIMARMALSYDFAFLALLRMAVSNECPGFDKGRCPFNPMAKCHYCRSDPGGALEISAACVVIMTYYKLRDNIADSSRLKSFVYRLLLPFAARAHKKALRKFPQIDEILGRPLPARHCWNGNSVQALIRQRIRRHMHFHASASSVLRERTGKRIWSGSATASAVTSISVMPLMTTHRMPKPAITTYSSWREWHGRILPVTQARCSTSLFQRRSTPITPFR